MADLNDNGVDDKLEEAIRQLFQKAKEARDVAKAEQVAAEQARDEAAAAAQAAKAEAEAAKAEAEAAKAAAQAAKAEAEAAKAEAEAAKAEAEAAKAEAQAAKAEAEAAKAEAEAAEARQATAEAAAQVAKETADAAGRAAEDAGEEVKAAQKTLEGINRDTDQAIERQKSVKDSTAKLIQEMLMKKGEYVTKETQSRELSAKIKEMQDTHQEWEQLLSEIGIPDYQEAKDILDTLGLIVIYKALKDKENPLKEAAPEAAEEVAADAVEEAADAVEEATEAVDEVPETVEEAAEEVVEETTEAVDEVPEAVEEAVEEEPVEEGPAAEEPVEELEKRPLFTYGEGDELEFMPVSSMENSLLDVQTGRKIIQRLQDVDKDVARSFVIGIARNVVEMEVTKEFDSLFSPKTTRESATMQQKEAEALEEAKSAYDAIIEAWNGDDDQLRQKLEEGKLFVPLTNEYSAYLCREGVINQPINIAHEEKPRRPAKTDNNRTR